jgi:hypothetical protein
MTYRSKSLEEAIEDREIVRLYSAIPRCILRFCPTTLIKRMYDKVMEQAVVDYGTPVLAGIPIDFNDIAAATVRVEAEIARRGLDRKPLNPDEERSPVYATDVWSDYLHVRGNKRGF